VPSPISGYDLLLDGDIGLSLFRDGRTPPVQGGRFSSSEAARAGGGMDQGIVYDNFLGGMGSTERLVPNTYPFAINGCLRFGRIWTPAGEVTYTAALPNGAAGRVPGEITVIAEFGPDLIIGAGGVLYRLPAPYTTPVVETTLGATEEVASFMVYHGIPVVGSRVIADGTPGAIYVKVAGVWTRSTTMQAEFLVQTYMTIEDVGDHRLITNDTPSRIRFISTVSATDLLDELKWAGTDTGSGDPYPVGDRTYPITNLVAAPLVFWVIKQDGLYHVQPDGRAARIVDWSNAIHPSNGKAAFFAFGGVYASHGRAGLVRVDVANQQVQWQTNACAPGAGLPRIVPVHGENTALTQDGEWLVDSVYNGTDSYVCYGTPNQLAQELAMEKIQSPQSLNWHGAEAVFWNQKITAMNQASLGPTNRPFLWVGVLDGSTPKLANVSLPALGTPIEDWIAEGPHRFATDSWLYLPREDYGARSDGAWTSTKKIFDRLDVTAEYMEPGTVMIDVYMATSEGYDIFWDRALDPDTTAWTFIGRFERGQRMSIVPNARVQSGIKAAIMLHAQGTRVQPWALSSIKLRAIPLLEQQERRQYTVMVGRSRKANRALDQRTVSTLLNRLWGLQWADPVTLLDRTNTTTVVKVEEGMAYQEVMDPVTQEFLYRVSFTVRILRRPFYWGTGARWGTDITWAASAS
jgi:hypothetical protein